MDKAQAIDTFWSGFGIPAYDETSVPDDATFPYLTYQVSTSSINETVIMNASLWYYGTSWEAVTKTADFIGSYIGRGGIMCLYDGGSLWVKRSTPFAQRMSDPGDPLIRRIVLTIDAEFISAN